MNPIPPFFKEVPLLHDLVADYSRYKTQGHIQTAHRVLQLIKQTVDDVIEKPELFAEPVKMTELQVFAPSLDEQKTDSVKEVRIKRHPESKDEPTEKAFDSLNDAIDPGVSEYERRLGSKKRSYL